MFETIQTPARLRTIMVSCRYARAAGYLRRLPMPMDLRASDLQNPFLFAYQANIDRYRRILETKLTAEQHSFFERRLAEEEAALEKLSHIFPS